MTIQEDTGISRRTLLQTGAATGALLMSPGVLRAQSQRTRKNLMDVSAGSDMQSYAKAVKAMLQLPMDDPRNWYRVAFVHFIDCPHGNWWFTSWHRGYLGFFEEQIREMSGNPDFMLPYWDWTANPYVPQSMFGASNPLDPVNYVPDSGKGYIETRDAFDAQVKEPMRDYWNRFSAAQQAEQVKRMTPTFNDMWYDPENGAAFAFQEKQHARSATAGMPNLDVNAAPSVAMDSLLDDLAPTVFAGDGVVFENPVSKTHQVVKGFSSLSRTHNIVHMSTGGTLNKDKSYDQPYGIMSQNLSPLDPLFFLHHGNIDRLWDVWTRKQKMIGAPIAPEGALLDDYKREPYLFFFDGKGDAVTENTTSWDYFGMERFDYTYQPGSGEQIVAPKMAGLATQRNALTAMASQASGGLNATADFTVDQNFLATAEQSNDVAQHFAQVTFVPPSRAIGQVFQLFISPQDEVASMDSSADDFVGNFAFFGQPHGHGPVQFTMRIDKTLDRLIANGTLTDGAPLSFSLRMAGGGSTALQSVDVKVLTEK